MRQAVKPQSTQKHIGFGKVILFGEHVVVHGAPALVAGVSEYTDCKLRVTKGEPGFRVVDNRPAVPGYKTTKAAEQRKAHQLVFDHLKIDTSKDGVEITLGGPLVPSSGIGASASDCVALSRALAEVYGLTLSEEEVNHSAFTGEGGYHGTPSGVDNTAATFGGLLTYQKTPAGPKFTSMPLAAPLHLVVVSTGITASTIEVVGDVRKWKEREPAKFEALMQEYAAIFAAANKAAAAGDQKTIGKLLDANHALCQKLGVSCKELEAIVNTARAAGAMGAKMSGTGRGGIAVALCASAADQEKVAKALETSCPAAKFVWRYTVAGRKSNL